MADLTDAEKQAAREVFIKDWWTPTEDEEFCLLTGFAAGMKYESDRVLGETLRACTDAVQWRGYFFEANDGQIRFTPASPTTGGSDAEVAGLLQRLMDESDLCANEGANDIVVLLDDAIRVLRSLTATLAERTAELAMEKDYGNTMREKHDDLVSRLAQVRMEAERYRYLRDNDCTVLYEKHVTHLLNDVPHGFEPQSLDCAIDVLRERATAK